MSEKLYEFDLLKSQDLEQREKHLLQAQERELWCKMLVAVANDSRVTKMSVAVAWANEAANEFNKKYGKGENK
jgi:hypothetical protein